jgi:hypothetical protein
VYTGVDPTALARFRPTRAQAVGRGMARGLLVGGALGLAALAGTLAGGSRAWAVALCVPVLLGCGVGAVAGLARGRRMGADADTLGVHRVPAAPPRWPPPLAPWDRIVDIRAERHGGRTVVAVHLDSSVVHRLAAPYDGRLLGHDPYFEYKLFRLRHLWETHRRWGTPG